MGDEDRGGPLPQRVAGGARTGPYPSGSALSGELRQRIQAAVAAERSAEGPRDREVTSPSVRGAVRGAVRGRRKRLATVPGGRAAQPVLTVSAEPVAEDEVTEWLGSAGPAPAVLASFGSGPAAIAVRVIAPNGAAAYQIALASSQAAGEAAWAALLADPRITVPPPASGQLIAGLVDSRLLRALRALAGHQAVSIVQFGNAGPGVNADVPLRFADFAEDSQVASLSDQAYVQAVRAYLGGVNAKFRPASMTTVVLADGQAVLRVGFAAPSPLTASGSPGSP